MRNPHPSVTIACYVVLTATMPAIADAQFRPDWRAEVFVSAGGSGFSRYDDRGFGRHSDFGAGAAVRIVPWVAAQVEVDRVLGLPAGSSECVANEPCAATTTAVSGLLLLSRSRIQPYLMGGMLFLHTQTGAYAPAGIRDGSRISETGEGPLVGAGAKVFLTRRLYVQPGFWTGTAVWLSRINLSASRASIAVGYRW